MNHILKVVALICIAVNPGCVGWGMSTIKTDTARDYERLKNRATQQTSASQVENYDYSFCRIKNFIEPQSKRETIKQELSHWLCTVAEARQYNYEQFYAIYLLNSNFFKKTKQSTSDIYK
jgi:hypothetical protein